MAAKKKYKIGISFNLESQMTDIWGNGANQNIVFLSDLFNKSELVNEVYLVSWGPERRSTPPEGFMSLNDLNLKFAFLDDVIDELDVLIEGMLIIDQGIAARMRQHGGKIVSYKMGPDYIMDVENFIFDKEPGRTLNGTRFDANWIIPQNMNTCASFFAITHRCQSYEVPAIWAPTFCDKVIANLKEKHGLEFGYKPQPEKKSRRLASFEPNIYIFKNCFIPVAMAEQAYRQDPEAIEHYYCCNTYHKRQHRTFHNFIGFTDIVRNNVMSVDARFQMPDFLTRYTDIVISHQWENGLNYAYNDALYGGYPFIHNSKLLPKGVGYYYDQFDAFDGANVILDVIKNHDKNHADYVKRANDYLESLSPVNPINIYAYERELKRLFEA